MLEANDIAQLAELAANPKIRRYLLARLSDTVARLHCDLTAAGLAVWFDRVSMPSRALTFHQEIRDAVAACDRLVLVGGPKAAESLYVWQEWQFAYFEAEKIVTPILRRGDYSNPDELKLLHCEDFRDDGQTQPIEQISQLLLLAVG